MPIGSGGGATGRPQARLDPVFATRLKELQANAAEQFLATQQGLLRPWQIPAAFDGDLNLPEALVAGFNRDALNTNYAQVLQDPDDPGTVPDCIALKHQIDMVAAEERAFRHRHASPCRLLAHASAKRYGQGFGRVFPAMREQVENIIQTGGAQS